MTALLLITLMIGGGTSFAAERSVPGDALYMVKTEVNEPIKSALAFSNTAEAELHAQLAEERLREAETLAADGRLSADVATELSTRLKAHYEEAAERSNKTEAMGDIGSSATVRASLEGTMRNAITVLTDLNARVTGNNGTAFISEVRTHANAAAEAQATATVGISRALETQVGHMVSHTDTFITDIRTRLDRYEQSVSAEVYAEAEARFEEAVSAHAEAQTKLAVEHYQEAYARAQEAIRIASEAIAMAESSERLGTQDYNSRRGSIKIDSRIDAQSTTSVRTDREDRGRSTDVRTKTEASIDTGVIDIDAESDTLIRTGL